MTKQVPIENRNFRLPIKIDFSLMGSVMSTENSKMSFRSGENRSHLGILEDAEIHAHHSLEGGNSA